MTAFLIANMAPIMFASLVIILLLGYPAVKMETHVEMKKALRRLPRLAARVAALEKGEAAGDAGGDE